MHILVATDGSECAAVAVDLVAGLSWPAETELQVVEVVPSGVAVFGGPWPPITPVDTRAIERWARAVRANLNHDVSHPRPPGTGGRPSSRATSGKPH